MILLRIKPSDKICYVSAAAVGTTVRGNRGYKWQTRVGSGDMGDEPTTPISGYDSESITIRERTLSSDIMGEMNFGDAAFLIVTGEEPTEAESEVFDVMLTSLLAHGMTSHAVAARLTFGAEPDSVQGAVASGVLGIGSQSAGAVRSAAETLQKIVAAEDPDAAKADLVGDAELTEPFGVSGFSGVGHGYFDPVDPRADKIIQTAERVDVAGEHTRLLGDLQEEFEERTGEDLPINVIGAIGAVASDVGLSPIAAQGIAIMSRTAGLVAAVESENESPLAGDIRSLLSDGIGYDPEG